MHSSQRSTFLPLGFQRSFLTSFFSSYSSSCNACRRWRYRSHQSTVSAVSSRACCGYLGRHGFCRHSLFGCIRYKGFQSELRLECFSSYLRSEAGREVRPLSAVSRLAGVVGEASCRLANFEWGSLPGRRVDLAARPSKPLGWVVSSIKPTQPSQPGLPRRQTGLVRKTRR